MLVTEWTFGTLLVDEGLDGLQFTEGRLGLHGRQTLFGQEFDLAGERRRCVKAVALR